MSTATAVADAREQGQFGVPDKALLVVAALIAGAACVYAVSGVYHLLDSWSVFHSWWHTTVPDKATRNDIRDVVEYLTGGYGAQLYTWNSMKWHARQGGEWIDKMVARVPLLASFRQVVRRFPLTELGVSYILSLPLAAIGFTAVYFLTSAIPAWTYQVPVPGHHKALVLSSLIINHKAMGLAASYFFGRHMMRMAYDDVQYRTAYAAAQRRHNLLSWLWLPTYRERVREIEAGHGSAELYSVAQKERGRRMRQAALISFAGLVFLWFVFYGYLVLKYTAHGHPMPWGLR